MLTKITVYRINITAEISLVAFSDAEALAEAQAWVKSDVTQLNYAMVANPGFQSDVKTATVAPAPIADTATLTSD